MTPEQLQSRKARIGVLGIMQELYLPIHPGIQQRQEQYALDVLGALKGLADFEFPGAAVNRTDIERILSGFNRANMDGVLIIMLTYGASFLTYNALHANRLPVLLTNIQPEETVGPDWDIADLTYNQGIHGAQDMANALMWTESRVTVWTGNWRSSTFREFVGAWANAVKVRAALPFLKVAQVGQMIAMGDIHANPAEIMSRLQIRVDQTGIGLIYREMEEATANEVAAVIAENEQNFVVDQAISSESHEYAARFQVGLERYLSRYGYAGVTVYFNAPAEDGRFRQLPLMAASNLMAKGYGYGGEGDIMSTILVTIGQLLKPDATFTEMYAMDFQRQSILMSHMGEGNWKIARKDRPVRLVDRQLGIGGLANPPTTVFSAEAGDATLVTLVSKKGGGFRLILSRGEILDTEEMVHVEMPYFHYRPDSGIETCQNGWLAHGGSHHQCLHLGDLVQQWRLLCELLDIEFIRV